MGYHKLPNPAFHGNAALNVSSIKAGWLTNLDAPCGSQAPDYDLLNLFPHRAVLKPAETLALPAQNLASTTDSCLFSSKSYKEQAFEDSYEARLIQSQKETFGCQTLNSPTASASTDVDDADTHNFFFSGCVPPNSHLQPPPSFSNSPSRQRSMINLTSPISVPAITRPSSIPTASSTRLFSPNSYHMNHINQVTSLNLQRVAFNPAMCNRLLHNARQAGHELNKPVPIPFPDNTAQSTDSKFVPMLAVIRPDKTGKDFTPASLSSNKVAALKFSPRYHGMHTENNASMEYLKPEHNCALWLTNLPADIEVRELLGSIRNIGRVYATYINYPDGVTHNTSAAKLVFFTPEAAQRLLAFCPTANPLVIRGYHVKIALNRIKSAKNSMENGESRVLIISGHKDFVNKQDLTAYFEARFQFQIDEVQTLIQHKERAVIEFKFGSYRCQAQMGMKALMLDRPVGLEMVEYGADPCEVGSDDTSFTVAGERIQGKGLCSSIMSLRPSKPQTRTDWEFV